MKTNTIGNNIRNFRISQGYRQDDLAEYLAVTRTMVSYYETGEREVPVASLNKLADLFGIDLEELLEDNSMVANANLAFAFRTETKVGTDTESIASFKRVVMNYLKMETLRDAVQH